MKRVVLTGICCVAGMLSVFGQANYRQVLTDRSDKIVRTLGIQDSMLYNQVLNLLVEQYVALGKIHDTADGQIAGYKQHVTDKALLDSLKKITEWQRESALYRQHAAFIASLTSRLTDDQVEAVKNGMTYDLLHVTYRAYLDMIPRLTDEEKQQIYCWLLEARELAMDASSSEKKHDWFGKYKGRINNYLSSRGYDLNQERKAWNERINAAKKEVKQ